MFFLCFSGTMFYFGSLYLQLQDCDSTPSGSVHSKDSDKESVDGALTNGNGFHKNPRDPADVGAGHRVSRSPSYHERCPKPGILF